MLHGSLKQERKIIFIINSLLIFILKTCLNLWNIWNVWNRINNKNKTESIQNKVHIFPPYFQVKFIFLQWYRPQTYLMFMILNMHDKSNKWKLFLIREIVSLLFLFLAVCLSFVLCNLSYLIIFWIRYILDISGLLCPKNVVFEQWLHNVLIHDIEVPYFRTSWDV